MTDDLRDFSACDHERWKCESCGCRTAMRTLQNTALINVLEGEIESLHRALDAAKAFIGSNACDSDTTPKMARLYHEYEEALQAAPAQEKLA